MFTPTTHILISLAAAVAFASLSIGAAVGPARAVETAASAAA